MMKLKLLFVLSTSLVLAGAGTGIAHASGSYSARPPRPPVTGTKLDSGKYSLGKKIYTGKAELRASPGAEAAQQEARLRALQNRLPKSAGKKVNLPSLAGKLSARELEALEYYVDKRYPAK
jgi:hypothetical protein